MLLSRVSLALIFLTILCVDMKVVDPVPAGCRCVRLTMAPAKPLTQLKRVASKGKAVTRPTTQPRTCKVTRIASPMPEVIEVGVPPPPIAGPSQVSRAPLLEEPSGRVMMMSGGRLLCPLVGDSWIQYCDLLTPFCCLSLWHTHLAEAQGQ